MRLNATNTAQSSEIRPVTKVERMALRYIPDNDDARSYYDGADRHRSSINDTDEVDERLAQVEGSRFIFVERINEGWGGNDYVLIFEQSPEQVYAFSRGENMNSPPVTRPVPTSLLEQNLNLLHDADRHCLNEDIRHFAASDVDAFRFVWSDQKTIHEYSLLGKYLLRERDINSRLSEDFRMFLAQMQTVFKNCKPHF